ncbi:MAG: FKBP-type peptidyl-prolyl cis-trans isomerase [Chlamydiota bacterium]
MTRFCSFLLLPVFFLFCVNFGYGDTISPSQDKVHETAQENQLESTSNIQEISESLGHLLVNQLNSMELDLNTESLLKGIQDAFLGKKAPLDESKCIQALNTIQEKKYQKQAKENLDKAIAFMEENSGKQGIIEAERDPESNVPLLQYRITQPGDGKIVEEHSSPLIRYKGTLPAEGGRVFIESPEEQRIHLDNIVTGFKKGVVGMREGEKRTLFIHPNFGYGEDRYALPPNSALVFEVEVIKANVPAKIEANASPISDQPKQAKPTDEIAQTHDQKLTPKKEVR